MFKANISGLKSWNFVILLTMTGLMSCLSRETISSQNAFEDKMDASKQFYQKAKLSYKYRESEKIIAIGVKPVGPWCHIFDLSHLELIQTLGYKDFMDTVDYSGLEFLQVNLGTDTISGKMLNDSTYEHLLISTLPLNHATFLNRLAKRCTKLHKLMISVQGDLSVHEKPLSILLSSLTGIDSLIIDYQTPFVASEFVNDVIFNTGFDNVKFLALSGEGWTNFPKQLSNRKETALKEIVIYNTHLPDLEGMSELDSLGGLTIISTRSNRQFNVDEVYSCNTLKTLALWYTTVDTIGPEVLNLSNLKEIDLVSNYQLSHIDNRIFCLSNLDKFSLSVSHSMRSWEPEVKRMLKNLYKDIINKNAPCLSNWKMHPWFSKASILIYK